MSAPTTPRKNYSSGYDRHISQTNRNVSPADLLMMQAVQESGCKKRKRGPSVIEEEAQQEEDGRIYRAVLARAMIPFRDTTEEILRTFNSSTQITSPSNLQCYRTPTKKNSVNIIDSPFRNSYSLTSPFRNAYSLTPLPLEAQVILTGPRKTPRYISRFPYKVLDAPDLQDDFYLNLVDWSSTNVLGVGLGSCVYLWNAVSSKVEKLCDMSIQASSSNGESPENVTSVSWMPTGTHIAIGTSLGFVEIWDVQKSKRIRKMKGHPLRVGALAWNSYTLSSGSRDKSIIHRDVRNKEDYTTKVIGHKQEVCGLKWNPEGTQLASGGNDNMLLIWDKSNDSPIYKFLHHTAAVKAIAWSPHSHGLLASGGGTQDKHIRFWSTTTGEALESYDTESQVCNLAWSRHANEIVSTHGYSQNQIILWKYPSMEQLAVLKGHSFRVLYLSVSPDGQNIVTGAGDETLRFWNIFNNAKKEPKRESFFNFRAKIR
nr:12265_t:CDS:2 [Entrophospora candida]